jgi:hypothetical protein
MGPGESAKNTMLDQGFSMVFYVWMRAACPGRLKRSTIRFPSRSGAGAGLILDHFWVCACFAINIHLTIRGFRYGPEWLESRG